MGLLPVSVVADESANKKKKLKYGKISALISFLRSLILQAIMIILLPMLLGLDGVWLAVVAAELLTVIVTIICFIRCRKKYHYA